ncbi:MAG: hypothetical protein AB1489_36845 [Acidobacteriota bacterium]
MNEWKKELEVAVRANKARKKRVEEAKNIRTNFIDLVVDAFSELKAELDSHYQVEILDERSTSPVQVSLILKDREITVFTYTIQLDREPKLYYREICEFRDDYGDSKTVSSHNNEGGYAINEDRINKEEFIIGFLKYFKSVSK